MGYKLVVMKTVNLYMSLFVFAIGGLYTQPVNAQISIRKPKVNISKKDSNEGKSEKSGDLKDKLDGKPEYNPDDPVYRAYSRTRDNLKSAQGILDGSSWDLNRENENEKIIRDLKKVEEGLGELKSFGEDKKSYYKEFEENYTNLEQKRIAEMKEYEVVAGYDKKLESYYRWVTMGYEMNDKTLEPSYSGYYSFKEDFQTNQPEKYKGDYVQKRITAVDNFFEVEVYQQLDDLEKNVDRLIKNAHKLNSRGEEDYLLNAKSHFKKMEELSKTVQYKKDYLLKDKSKINEIENKLNNEKSTLGEYIDSGKCDAYRAKYEKELVDAVRLGGKAMSNTKYEAMASKGVDSGTPLRTVITSAVWQVKKNDFGYPQYKYLDVDIAVKKEGKCYLSYGQIRRNYEGGGSYGGEYFNYWGIQSEMNCDNVNK